LAKAAAVRQEHKEDAKPETELRAEEDKTVVPIVADKAGDEAEPAEPEVPLTAAEGARAPRMGVGQARRPAFRAGALPRAPCFRRDADSVARVAPYVCHAAAAARAHSVCAYVTIMRVACIACMWTAVHILDIRCFSGHIHTG